MKTVSFTLNGAPARVTVDETRPLLWVLRDDLALTGTKYGCGEAVCGACTVLLDDEPVRSCATAVGEVEGRRVTTIEGLARDGRLHPVQQAFVDRLAFQCGFCTPGMVLAACALLRKNPAPTRRDIVGYMDDHLCRCGAHVRIVEAIEHAVTTMKGASR
jgi:aerobic-type carbon monoxide dehydrogenase small subunit (CoxS/CutS family)